MRRWEEEGTRGDQSDACALSSPEQGCTSCLWLVGGSGCCAPLASSPMRTVESRSPVRFQLTFRLSISDHVDRGPMMMAGGSLGVLELSNKGRSRQSRHNPPARHQSHAMPGLNFEAWGSASKHGLAWIRGNLEGRCRSTGPVSLWFVSILSHASQSRYMKHRLSPCNK